MNLLEAAAAAGVIGAGGAGFPAHVKLSGARRAGVDTVVGNGAECEPLLRKDQVLMTERAAAVVRGLAVAREAAGAGRAVLATKAKYGPVVAALERAVADHAPEVQLVTLPDFYPAGDEVVLLAEVLGRVVPPGALPLSVGAVVFNVETLGNLEAAGRGEPVTTKWLTVTGAVAHPCTLEVPVGTTFPDLLAAAGGVAEGQGPGAAGGGGLAVLAGGPMMGALVAGPQVQDLAVTKKTAGFVVLPEPGALHQAGAVSLAHQLVRAASACCGCRLCTDLCPRSLLGHPFQPHQVMVRAAATWARAPRLDDPSCLRLARQALLCSECGVCDTWACPLGLSPRRVCVLLKQLLRAAGIRPEAAAEGWSPASARRLPEGRRVPAGRLAVRLGLERIAAASPGPVPSLHRVRLALAAQAGPAAVPLVTPGERVDRGQVVARAAGPDGALWTQVHASVQGRVTQVSASEVVLETAG